VGWAIGGIFLLIAFLPKVSAILLAMPRPVIGAALVFSACFVFVNGLQIITSRMLDARRTFVVGTSFMLGLAVDLFPGAFVTLPAGLRPIFSTSLVLGTLSAIGLNALFRLGVRQRAAIVVVPGEPSSAATHQFLAEQGAQWGARSDVIDRASFNLAQSIETIADGCEPEGPLEVEAAFDEFSLDLRVTYTGAPLELPMRRPSNEEIIASEDGQRKLAGYMLRRYADRVEASYRAGRATILFHFDH
jgi:xanthine permease XanP